MKCILCEKEIEGNEYHIINIEHTTQIGLEAVTKCSIIEPLCPACFKRIKVDVSIDD